MWKIHSPHGDQQRNWCQPHRVTLGLPCHGPSCSVVACEWTTCCHLQPHAAPPHCLRVPHPKSALTVTLQPENEPRSLGLALPSSIKAWGFYLLTCARLCRQKRERCSPTPSLHLYKSSAHSLSSQQSTSQLLPFEYKGPSKRKRHLARAFQIKTVQQIFVWKCSKMRFNTLKKQRGDISSYTPST